MARYAVGLMVWMGALFGGAIAVVVVVVGLVGAGSVLGPVGSVMGFGLGTLAAFGIMALVIHAMDLGVGYSLGGGDDQRN